MSVVYAILLIAIVLIVYFFLVEIFVTLFRMTGLTSEKAFFQVISMITAVGFTTQESEIISGDRTRRRLAVACMITGTTFNVVIIGLLINLVYSFNSEQLEDSYWIVGMIVLITVLLLILMRLPFFNKISQKFIEYVADHVFKMNANTNVQTQIDSYGKSGIFQINVNIVPEVLKDKTLGEANLKANYGINIMMMRRNGRTIEINKDTIIQKKDIIWVFGVKTVIKDFFSQENKPATQTNNSAKSRETFKINEISIVDNYGQDAMVEVTIHNMPKSLQDKALSETNLRSKYYITVLKIKRGHGSVSIDKDTVLNIGDTVLLLGPYKGIKAVFDTKTLTAPSETGSK